MTKVLPPVAKTHCSQLAMKVSRPDNSTQHPRRSRSHLARAYNVQCPTYREHVFVSSLVGPKPITGCHCCHPFSPEGNHRKRQNMCTQLVFPPGSQVAYIYVCHLRYTGRTAAYKTYEFRPSCCSDKADDRPDEAENVADATSSSCRENAVLCAGQVR